MPTRIPLGACRNAAATSWRSLLPTATTAAISLATLTGGAALLFAHQQQPQPGRVMAPAGIVLLLCGAVQARLTWRLWNQRAARQSFTLANRAVLEQLFLGACVAYLAAILIGPVRHVGYGLLAVMVIWYTLLLALEHGSLVLPHWRSRCSAPLPRRLAQGAVAVFLALIAAEAGLQIYKLLVSAGRTPITEVAIADEQAAPSDVAADLGFANERLANLKVGPLRVAVLSDNPPANRSEYVARIEQTLSGIKIVAVDLPQPWTNVAPRQVAESFAEARVDLVLAMLSVCDDLTRDVPAPSWFDWRQFELARWLRGTTAPAATVLTAKRAADFESFCRSVAPQLAACRTPIDERMRTRWQQTLQAVDGLVAQCDSTKVEVALVLVPGEFQVNRALCATLARRSGYAPGQLDVDLPQRKLACYAAKRRVPVVDLLPALRLLADSPYERNAETWNEDGHAAAAGAISGWLESRYGRQLGVSARLTSAPY
ncbi:MAG: hypothetical protein AB7O59_24405 [Pirellulales bacterium]